MIGQSATKHPNMDEGSTTGRNGVGGKVSEVQNNPNFANIKTGGE